jgi:hypothetical protein
MAQAMGCNSKEILTFFLEYFALIVFYQKFLVAIRAIETMTIVLIQGIIPTLSF